MPKEIIADSIGGFRIETSWGRADGCVQVATTCAGRKRILGIVNDWLELAGLPPLDVADLEQRLRGKGAEPFDGWHVTLTDRDQLNELIRHARRARDHAFGRDE